MAKLELTQREYEVYRMLIDNNTTEDILDKLSISMATLKTHANRIYQKTGVNGRVELIVEYYKELLRQAFKNSF